MILSYGNASLPRVRDFAHSFSEEKKFAPSRYFHIVQTYFQYYNHRSERCQRRGDRPEQDGVFYVLLIVRELPCYESAPLTGGEG